MTCSSVAGPAVNPQNRHGFTATLSSISKDPLTVGAGWQARIGPNKTWSVPQLETDAVQPINNAIHSAMNSINDWVDGG
jgi:hypothetical protein